MKEDMLIGVDIGGTFTDLVLSQDGKLTIHKLPSTPQHPAQAMLAGLQAITGGRVAQLNRVAHGSTVATNAILERKGAKSALITTQGFKDLLFIGRQNRPALYALHPQLPPPLIPPERCYEVPERLDHTGATLLPLDMAALDTLLDQVAAQGVDSVAVCLLYSYVNPAHEQAIRQRIVERGLLEAWQVALSCEVLPEFREYERASTAALEAYVRPVMSRYITQLQSALSHHNPQMSLRIMKSDGGVMSATRVQQQAIQTALSGPAAGVIGAAHIAALAGYENVITLDMGGTSTDVAICPGQPIRRPQSEIDGLPLRIRLLDIETIGAGGGSIARVDAGGLLRVGPQSAGADPGPVVYGRGGDEVTVSDANAYLGRLDAAHFLGGGMTLEMNAMQQTIEKLAAHAGLSTQATAQGVIDIANANIDRALRRVTVARGHDPRDFTLVAFGGAGGLHACALADQLEIPRVLIPRHPGVLCAFGLLVADVVLEYSQSVLGLVDASTLVALQKHLAELTAQAAADLAHEGIPPAQQVYVASLDLRYQGQAYELNLPFAAAQTTNTVNMLDIEAAFHDLHQRTYGHNLPQRPVEVVNLRLRAVGEVPHPALTPEPENPAEAQPIGRKTCINGENLALYAREGLLPGMYFHGGALVFQLDSTLYIPAGWAARVDGYHNLILTPAP